MRLAFRWRGFGQGRHDLEFACTNREVAFDLSSSRIVEASAKVSPDVSQLSAVSPALFRELRHQRRAVIRRNYSKTRVLSGTKDTP